MAKHKINLYATLPMTASSCMSFSCLWICTAMAWGEQKTEGAEREVEKARVDFTGQESFRGLPNHSMGNTKLPFWKKEKKEEAINTGMTARGNIVQV